MVISIIPIALFINRIIDIVAILINQGGGAVITFFNSKILFDSAIFVGV